MNLFDILKSISYTKEDLSDHIEFEKVYNPFMVNRYVSMLEDTVKYSCVMNLYWNLSKKMQYHYYLAAIPKKSRFFKYQKHEKSEQQLKDISLYFNVNMQTAEQFAEILEINTVKAISNLMKEYN